MLKKGILHDNSGQGSIEYLLLCIGALIVALIFMNAMKGSISDHSDSIVRNYTEK